MIIEVTQEDIKKGIRLDIHTCPIALALKRVFPHENILVYSLGLIIGQKGYHINKDIYEFILNFDNNCEVKPFSFDLDSLKRWR